MFYLKSFMVDKFFFGGNEFFLFLVL